MASNSETLQQILGDFSKQASEYLKENNALERLGLSHFQENLERVTTLIGVKPNLRKTITLNRRSLDVLYLPIYTFSQQRAVERNAEADDNAISVVLQDPHMARFIAKYVDMEPSRTMSTAPKHIDSFLQQIQEVQRYVLSEGPIVFSLVSRLDAVVSAFLQYTQAMFSSIARYLSLTDRFAKNKRALFFFGKYTLPKLLKVLFIINDIEAQLLRRSEMLESPEDAKHLRQQLRVLVKKSSETVGSLHDLSKGCLIGCSAAFQIEYAVCLKNYEEGERADIAFHPFASTPPLEGMTLPSSAAALGEANAASSTEALDASQYLKVVHDQAQAEQQRKRREHVSKVAGGVLGVDPEGAALGAGLGLEEESTSGVTATTTSTQAPEDGESDRDAALDLLNSY
ncbi:putative kelch motif domain-containing protein [Neospora caninum Liverpool]|nr:putative kelch motif domain-containing protein [Neospora caninum Liverpool]CBZ50605.1 putative kelch motif domain-containing protein [Neospora caninum Liverpool]|eukprot:XP_003880638.1 putative kelch motif domain-containing protein [Neospora caninum Liverpool]